MANETILIYYDENRNFYVKKSLGGSELLPSNFIDFRRDQQKILASAYPHMGEKIMGGVISDEEAKRLISDYNEKALSTKITRWYKLEGSSLVSIFQEPKDVFQAGEYEGDEIPEDIIKFINSLKRDLFHLSYLAFKCPECKEMQYQPIINNRVRCNKCHEVFFIDDNRLTVSKKFDSPDDAQNRANAIEYLYNCEKEPIIDEEKAVNSNAPFYFENNVYRITFMDCKSLHQKLYEEFAFEQIFTKENNKVVFSPSYKGYLKGLKDAKINSTFYNQLKGAENAINSQEYALLPEEKAFFWYINKYCLTDETKIYWRISNRTVCFKSKLEFINEFLVADNDKKLQLISLYQSIASITDLENCFFDGCNGSLIDLSYMIYRETGLFVYVSEEKTVNFGSSFIANLHRHDNLIADRNIFIETIRTSSFDFWNEIKGTFDDYSDVLYDSFDGSYYDRLCYYQYAICGKSEIRYKGIVLSDSVMGFNHIKTLVCDAYLSKNDDILQSYGEMAELLRNSSIWDNYGGFVKIRAVKTAQFSNGVSEETVTFDILREAIAKESGKMPSTALYLKCTDTSSNAVANIRFWYNGILATLLEHIRRLIESASSQTVVNDICKFYADADISCIIKLIFNNTKVGGFDKFSEEQQNAFFTLVNEAERLNQELEAQRKKIAEDEMRGKR